MTNQLWSEFNAYRQSKGLNALKWSGKYAGWTKTHCAEMAKKKMLFMEITQKVEMLQDIMDQA